MSEISAHNLVWIDLEMTGLDSATDAILEIATVVTDKHLRVLGEGPVIAIHHSDALLARMDDWNTQHHGASGLTERVRNSAASTEDAEAGTLEFLQRWVPRGASPMCGNSICQDRRFMARLMPRLESYFHYRNLDVSTLKELATRWAPTTAAAFSKDSRHLALEDVYDSINELRHYRKHFLVIEPGIDGE